MIEARAALWEQTILPLAENTIDHIGRWLAKLCKDEFILKLDKDKISALANKREAIWGRLEKVSFMTTNEKRKQVGLARIKGGDIVK